MRLLIIRHAIAVARGTPGIADAERPLTPKGERRFRRAARGLRRIVPRPDALLTSPWRRARRTAEIAAAAWGQLEPKDVPALAEGSFSDLARLLESYPKDALLALVGHEPGLSALLSRLLRADDASRFTFRKGGVALVELHERATAGGRLLFYLPPRILRELG